MAERIELTRDEHPYGEPPRRTPVILHGHDADWWLGEGADDRFWAVVQAVRRYPYSSQTWPLFTDAPEAIQDRVLAEVGRR